MIAYCIPSGDTWKADTSVSFGGLCAYSASKGVEACIMNIRVCSVAHSRNQHVYDLLQFKDPCITHFFWIDSDMAFPPDGLMRLLAHNKQMIGAFYPQKAPPHEVVGRPTNMEDLEKKKGIIQADILGGGFVLVKREIYESSGIECPWYEERYFGPKPGLVSDDVVFSHKCRCAGIDMWADLDLSRDMGHSGNNLVRFAQPSQPQA
jgi:hypothetical protein